jgi:predicted amidohydrolase
MDARQFPKTRSKEDAFKEAAEKIEKGAIDKPDIFLLPEAFLLSDNAERFRDPAFVEEQGSDIYKEIGGLCKKHNSYIAAPLISRQNGDLYNSTVIFNRRGEPVFTYNKAYPTARELELGVKPGNPRPECFESEFGRISVAICFDLQFQPLFRHYYDKGAELLLFSSFFPGGFILRSLAFRYSFFAVSSHAQGEESVFIDNYGREIDRAGLFTPALTRKLELDSAILTCGSLKKIPAVKEKYGDAVEIEVHRPEGRIIIREVGGIANVQDIIREFELKTPEEQYQSRHLLKYS